PRARAASCRSPARSRNFASDALSVVDEVLEATRSVQEDLAGDEPGRGGADQRSPRVLLDPRERLLERAAHPFPARDHALREHRNVVVLRARLHPRRGSSQLGHGHLVVQRAMRNPTAKAPPIAAAGWRRTIPRQSSDSATPWR